MKLTTFTLMYAMIAATVISLILISYPSMALIVMLTVGQILFGVLGYASLWGLNLNFTAMVAIVMAVGFSVDNAAHFCHSFMTAPLKTDGTTIFLGDNKTMEYSTANERKARVLYALNAVGMPIIAGNLSTFIAILPLGTAKSQVVLAIFKVISLVMLFGMSHSIIYLPVMLSIVGPLGFDKFSDQSNGLSSNKDKNAEVKGVGNLHIPVHSTATTASGHHVDELMKAHKDVPDV